VAIHTRGRRTTVRGFLNLALRAAVRPELQNWRRDDRDVHPCQAPAEDHRGQDQRDGAVANFSGTPRGSAYYKDANSYPPCCTDVLEANLNSNVIGVAHIEWLSRDPQADPSSKVTMLNTADLLRI
jgi:hypothetical protein